MTRRTLPAWLAILAIALQALWPLLAQARPAAPGYVLPLCSIDGVTHYVEIPGATPPLEQRSATLHEHCPLCVFGVERLAPLPPAPLPALRAALAALAVPQPQCATALCSDPDSPAAARAPPAAS
jgi:hypothetical protein